MTECVQFIKMTDTNGVVRVINRNEITDFANKTGHTYHVGLKSFGFDITVEEFDNVVEPQL